MQLPTPRGPLSHWVRTRLQHTPANEHDPRPGLIRHHATLHDPDVQLALWMLYELHYRGFDDARADAEWDPELLACRADIEAAFEAELRALTDADVALVDDLDVVAELKRLIAADDGASVATYIHQQATVEQFYDFMRQRSIFHLKESDAFAWPLPRLAGAPKVALAELLYDEFGDGVVERDHQRLFAEALAACGLDATYGGYINQADAITLAQNNAMSLFGLHRRLLGAAVGHLAAFEATSTLPCRRICQGIDRLELPAPVHRYFDEHVEADAVHEQVALGGICAPLAEQEPALTRQILLGAATCLRLQGLAAAAMLARWQEPDSARSA